MSNSDAPFMSSSTESPLDLTVKRPDMDDHSHAMQAYEYERYMSYNNTINVPITSEYVYNQYPQTSAPEEEYQYTNGYCSDIAYNQRPIYSTSPLPVSQPSFTTQAEPYGCPQGQNTVDSYNTYGTQSHSPTYDSSIIPKKRKNLWRPYDSKLAQQGGDIERESDSGSDTASGSSSDQEYKTTSPSADPVKKRRIHRVSHSNRESSIIDKPVKSGSPDGTYGIHKQADKSKNTDWYVSPPNDETIGPLPTATSDGTGNNLPRIAEGRDKLISGMKKRDIFGWSLKLKTPAVSEDVTISNEIDASQNDEQRVCTDGNKTYIELQTVKKTSSPEPQNVSKLKEEPSSPRSQLEKLSPTPKLIDSQNEQKTDNTIYETNLRESEKENTVSNYVGKKVYIQRRDNVIECCNEADSKKKPEPETKKGLSLIDLIEEIEASARTQDKDEIEKTNQRNRNIAKLLDQCNYVKLQALDYLMANVLIQDKQTQFKSKNEKVQKMLNGDKINSVNMLDVVELQVEMGLN